MGGDGCGEKMMRKNGNKGSGFELVGSSEGILDLCFIDKDRWKWKVIDIDGGIDWRWSL